MTPTDDAKEPQAGGVIYDREHAQRIFNAAAPFYKNRNLLLLYLYLSSCLVTSASWGFDQSLTNGLQSVNQFMEAFGHPKGAELGFFGASMSVGGIIATIVGGSLVDRLGRRAICFIGAAIVIGMAIMEALSTTFAMFTGAKLVLGLGAVLQQISAPVLATELAHPKDRVALTSLYNTSILLGLIAGSWTTFGTFRIDSDWSWKIPCLLQIILPAYQMCIIWFCPESPRWYVAKGDIESARKLLTKWHGNGEETEVVQMELAEIIAGVQADKTMMKFNKESLKTIVTHKGNLHRLWICFWVAIGSQCLGSSLVASYMPLILEQVGLKTSAEKTLIGAIQTTWSWVVAVPAAFVIARVGRRTVFLICTGGMTLVFVVWTALAERYLTLGNDGFGIGVVVMIFLFSTFSSFAWIPLIITYPLEVATAKQRGVFFAFTMFSINASAFVVTYINPIAIESISWRYYIIQCAFNGLMMLIIWFTFVETTGQSLEEIAGIFDGQDTFDQLAQVTNEKQMQVAEDIRADHVETNSTKA